ncbi:SRPBCC family protein [Mycobacteroides abscessus]
MPEFDASEWTVGDSNTITFSAPPSIVFDLVTQARFWPQWHTSSRAVGGVTQRPYRTGDTVYEHGELEDGSEQHLYWHVAEQQPGQRSVLVDHDNGVALRYELDPADHSHTKFTRQTLYRKDSAFTAQQKNNITAASEASITRFQNHIETIINQERESLPGNR